MVETTISKAFGTLEDPRKITNPPHPLINIITLCVCSVICGADNFVAIEQYAKAKKEWFSTFLDLSNGIPSHDTLNDVMNRVKTSAFSECFTQWVMGLAEHKEDVIALDGKVMRRTLDKVNGGKATWLVNAWSVANNMCFGQKKVDDKSNEITAIPAILDILDIEGATVTTDAMGAQTKIADNVVDRNAHFVMGLKGNQGTLHHDVAQFLDDLIDGDLKGYTLDEHVDVNGDHGRIEIRKVWNTTDIEWLKKSHPRWSMRNGIVAVESHRNENDETKTERRYYITSHDNKSAEEIGKMIRSHWHVENKLHWQLDVSFDEDSCRLRSGHAAANFALFNKIALNLLKNETSVKAGIKTKRLRAGWDNEYLMKVLTGGLT